MQDSSSNYTFSSVIYLFWMAFPKIVSFETRAVSRAINLADIHRNMK